MLTFEVRHGREVLSLEEEFVAFRLSEFRQFPYLYEGTAAAECAYLKAYAAESNSMLVTIREAGRAVGMLTSVPLLAKSFPAYGGFADGVRQLGHDPAEFFYFGEAIVLPEYRNRGLARRGCGMIEAYARLLGYRFGCMATVSRLADHPLRPVGYQDPGPVFAAFEFKKTRLTSVFAWPTVQPDGSVKTQENTMDWWIKPLGVEYSGVQVVGLMKG